MAAKKTPWSKTRKERQSSNWDKAEKRKEARHADQLKREAVNRHLRSSGEKTSWELAKAARFARRHGRTA